MVKNVIGDDVNIVKKESNDNLISYIIKKIYNELGFYPKFTIEDAIKDLKLF